MESDDGGPADIKKVKPVSPLSKTNTIKSGNNETETEIAENESDGKEEHDNTIDKTESDIDLEIEAELDAMETTLPPGKKVKVIDKAKENEIITVDWSDVQCDTSPRQSKGHHSEGHGSSGKGSGSSGVLKLSKGKERTSSSEHNEISISNNSKESSSQQSIERTDSGEDWSDTWPEQEGSEQLEAPQETGWSNDWSGEQTSPTNINSSAKKDRHKLKSSDKTPEGKNKTMGNKGKISKNQGLGAEFDVMALDIKTSIQEMDYFADMMPDIKPKAGDLYSALGLTDSAGQR